MQNALIQGIKSLNLARVLFIYLFIFTLLLTLYLVRLAHDMKKLFHYKIYSGQK